MSISVCVRLPLSHSVFVCCSISPSLCLSLPIYLPSSVCLSLSLCLPTLLCSYRKVLTSSAFWMWWGTAASWRSSSLSLVKTSSITTCTTGHAPPCTLTRWDCSINSESPFEPWRSIYYLRKCIYSKSKAWPKYILWSFVFLFTGRRFS